MPLPDPLQEAYATMWYGYPGGRAFDGLKVLIHSIRAVDVQRSIVLLTLADTPADAAAASASTANGEPNPLRMLAHAYPRVHLLPTPFYTIFHNRNVTCKASLRRSCGGGGNGKRYLYMYSKFALWGMTQWSRIFYVDADALVLNPLDYLWSNVTLGKNIVVAASYTIRVGKRAEPLCGRGWAQYNAGVMLIRPAAAVMRAVLELLAVATDSHASPCRSDQTFFSAWFAGRHTRCMPHSFNCRDPRLQQQDTEEAATLSRCLDDHKGRRARSMPHVMHFACGSMPNASAATDRNATVYARAWALHLERSNEHIASEMARAGGAAKLVAAERGVVLEHYNPWKPICYSMSRRAQSMLQC